ncbi:MAG: DNA helicase RecQ [Alphaproteobacteria bacterium]|nr:DNA helicase RecQ [Alphaproteobacteria bacterium]
MSTNPEEVLKNVFGFPGFRPGQREIVDRLLAGTNTLSVMPTGAGKSICYQVPALMGERLTVVVSPLVALMDDQVAALQANGAPAVTIHSNRARPDNVADWRMVADGTARVLYLSPERLMTPRMLAALESLKPAMFIVDEAHCISKWGFSFRPEYEALSELRVRFPDATLGAFTATADAATRRDIVARLFGGKGDVVVRGFDRPNLQLAVTPKTDWRAQLLDFLEPRRDASGIVYCLSRRLTEEVAQMLGDAGFRALPYHAGLDQHVRRENQEAFMAEDGLVMVATIAFGMGIDKPDIRYVFHLNMPGSMEAYYQEIGRAGRDGNPADVRMLYGLDDIRMRRQFIAQDEGDEEHKRREHKRLDALLAYAEATRCRRVSLLTYFGEESEACGNCDLCLDPPELIDGTDDARAVLAVVSATGQMFGVAHVIDVLRGADTAKVRERGHERLSAYGTGAHKAKPFWQAFIRQVVAAGYLSIDVEGYGGLKLTQRSDALLQGDERFEYRDIPRSRPTRKSRRADVETDDIDNALFAQLKALRRDLAVERNVPAYVVFSDATLRDMCALMPQDLDTLALVNGVGPKKLESFGEAFLGAVRAHAERTA